MSSHAASIGPSPKTSLVRFLFAALLPHRQQSNTGLGPSLTVISGGRQRLAAGTGRRSLKRCPQSSTRLLVGQNRVWLV